MRRRCPGRTAAGAPCDLYAGHAGEHAPADPIPRYFQLDVWMALGGHPSDFETWRDGRGFADAWSQLMAAVSGNVAALLADTNPPAGEALIALVAPKDGTP